MEKALTDKQAAVLKYIILYNQEHKQNPSVREMAAHFGITAKAVQDRIVALHRKGALDMSGGKSRAIRVLWPYFVRGGDIWVKVLNYSEAK